MAKKKAEMVEPNEQVTIVHRVVEVRKVAGSTTFIFANGNSVVVPSTTEVETSVAPSPKDPLLATPPAPGVQ